ncbi:putative N-acetyltransferase YsnE [Corynebacterium occultum]|uniref:Putative N-acetyltransferase YsnE n=1 Tax=Corynebacterium occultum TaxID=2675219 RepID=A0A6B8W8V6_9CORY|nr:GNAT family N-acetyltransferase [Corynebacterium occultum]QGU07346.1 putative N-acetyltransferase YsnE [Corynebacterium occultum]
MSSPTLIHARLDAPETTPMIEALISEYSRRYPDDSAFNVAEEMALYPPLLFTPPHGDFLLIRQAGETIAGGGFMYLDEETAEIKRMWTSPDHRRQGLARTLVSALEAEIGARGYRRIYLTTGARQPEAQQMYRHLGYTPLFDETADPESLGILAFEKEITPGREGLLIGDPELAEQQKRTLEELLAVHPLPEIRLKDLDR